MVETATLRSGYELKDVRDFSDRLEQMLEKAMKIPSNQIFDDDE